MRWRHIFLATYQNSSVQRGPPKTYTCQKSDIFFRNIYYGLLLHTKNASRIRLMISIQWEILCHAPSTEPNNLHTHTLTTYAIQWRHNLPGTIVQSTTAQPSIHFRHAQRVMWSLPHQIVSRVGQYERFVNWNWAAIHGSRDVEVSHLNTNCTTPSFDMYMS